MRVRTLGTLAVIALMLAPTFPIPALAADAAPAAFVIVDGRRVVAQKGAFLAQGGRNEELKVCVGVDHQIEIELPKSFGYANVGAGVDENCTLRVTEVAFERNGRHPDGTRLALTSNLNSLGQSLGIRGALAEASTRRVWGRHLMHEQFHITTTLAHQDFTYWESGTSVSSPAGFDQYCWHDGVGWTTLYCYQGTDESGPSVVKRSTTGGWTNQGGSLQHNLGARPWATYWSHGVSCDQIGATMPFGWHDHCEFGRVY